MTYLTEPDAPPPTERPRPRCHHLRTKMFYVGGPDEPEMDESFETSHYWCLRSMQAFGPDGEFVCPEACQPGRHCFDED